MTIEFAEKKDLEALEQRLLDAIDALSPTVPPGTPPVLPPPTTEWEDVTSEFLFSTKGGRPGWVNVGTGGVFRVRARFGPGRCEVRIFAKFGPGWSAPNESQWRIFPLTPRVTPIERAVGTLRLWFEGQGSITGGESAVVDDGLGGWCISALWTPLGPNPGWLTSKYPERNGTPMWAKDGSYFLIDRLEYETAG